MKREQHMTAQPWEHQEQEPRKAYELARLYFELGANRSLKHVADVSGKHIGGLKTLCHRYGWVARAEAYDYYVSQVEQTARDTVLVEAAQDEAQQWVRRIYDKRERVWSVSQRLLDRAEEMLQTPLEDMRWTPRDIATYSDLAMRLSQHIENDIREAQNTSANSGINVTVQYVDM